MHHWNKVAGILTLFGLTGLFLSPSLLTPAVSAPVPQDRTVTIAIAAGPYLRLVSIAETTKTEVTKPDDHKQAMVCGRVFRLAFADVGFSCKDSRLSSFALARP